MAEFTAPPNVADRIGLWEVTSGNALVANGKGADRDAGAAPASLARATIEVVFTQPARAGGTADVVVSRGGGDAGFAIRVTGNGRVQAFHSTGDGDHSATLASSAGFVAGRQDIKATYAFDATLGARLTVENQTSGKVETCATDIVGLRFALTREGDEQFATKFKGSVGYVAVYTTTDEPVFGPSPRGPHHRTTTADGTGASAQPDRSGTVIFYKDDSQTEEAGRLAFADIESVIPCFTPGAMIATAKGEVPVESLRAGDRIITRDNGIQQIRWTGKRTLDRTELARNENMKPIVIRAGALGSNLPERDMVLSPEHRLLITGEAPQRHFDENEVLVAARYLVGKAGVGVVDAMRATYVHFMFDRHEVVLSDGVWTESFQPSDQSLGALGEPRRAEIFRLFPTLASANGPKGYAAARRSIKAHEAKLLRT